MSEGFVVRCRKEVCDVIDKYREGLTISEVIGLLMEIAIEKSR